MSTSFFFNNYQYSQEQELIDNLVMESIKIYGIDTLYIPRQLRNKDSLYGEDRQSSAFPAAYPVEMYVKSINGFAGDGNFLSKFGLEIRNQVVLTVSRRAFESEVGGMTLLQRPREGDLVFLPFNSKVFEIKFTNHEPIFYQLGSLQMYDLTCELFEYSSEKFTTGYPEVDKLYEDHYMATEVAQPIVTDGQENVMIVTEDDEILTTEGTTIKQLDPASDNEKLEQEGFDTIDFSESNLFSQTRRF